MNAFPVDSGNGSNVLKTVYDAAAGGGGTYTRPASAVMRRDEPRKAKQVSARKVLLGVLGGNGGSRAKR